MITLGMFADKPTGQTGMSVVNSNLAHHLCRITEEMRIIYFARFGQDEAGVAKTSIPFDSYEVVNCEGGVWNPLTVELAIRRYKLNAIYSEDDWWSAKGLVMASKKMKVPFYFLTPIDSLPIHREGQKIFKECRKVFVPNQSYRYIPNGVYLPHAVDWMTFRPVRGKASDKFIFLWIGRDERRKALGRAILAFEKIYKKYDCKFVVRTNWGESAKSMNTHRYIQTKRLPIIQDRMSDCPHGYLANVYSACHAYICSSKAGGSEMGILEANACGLPSLTTDWTFMNENVKNGKTGFLIPVESYDRFTETVRRTTFTRTWGNISIDRLAEKMIWMIEHKEKALGLGVEGLLWVRELKWEDVAERFMDTILEDLNVNHQKPEKSNIKCEPKPLY